MKKIVKWVLIGLLVVFIGIQFVPVNRENPPITGTKISWNTPKTEEFARRACFDCHSNETKWPWYSYVAPFSWLVANHVVDGRRKLNFSEFEAGDGDECAEEVEKGAMPMGQYTLMHSEAKFTDSEKAEFIAGLKATFNEGISIEDMPQIEPPIFNEQPNQNAKDSTSVKETEGNEKKETKKNEEKRNEEKRKVDDDNDGD